MRKLLLLTLLPFLSCKHNPDGAVTLPANSESVSSYSDKTGVEDTAYVMYAVDTTDLAPEPATPVKLLLEGSFHKKEVWQGAEKKNWMGLFYEDNQYVLKPTSFQVIPTFDRVADAMKQEKGKRVISGREVVGESPNTLFFLTGLQNLTEGTVDTAAFTKVVIPANKSLTYTFRGKDFVIQSYGDSVRYPSNEYGYQNYGWKVSGYKKGKKVEQVLAEDELFDKSVYVLLWAGDLDRDGIPDLLLDISNHYNVSRVALFLSAQAAKGKLYEKAAVFETVGM